MLKEFYARNFRGFKEIKIKNLKRINVFTGANGCGKTSLLEIPFLLAGANNAQLVISLYNFRNESELIPGYDRFFKDIFYDLDISNSIELWSRGEFRKNLKTTKRTLKITPTESKFDELGQEKINGLKFDFRGPNGPKQGKIFWESETQSVDSSVKTQVKHRLTVKTPQSKDSMQCYFASPYYTGVWGQAHRLLTDLTKKGKMRSLIENLKIIESSLENLLPLSEQRISVIYADIGRENLLPVSLLGGGFANMLHIILDASVIQNGIFLIDEIEDGLHFSIISKLIEFLFTISEKNNIQLFVSTHSEEIINAFVNAATKKNFSDIGLFRLSKKEGVEKATFFSINEIVSSREMNAELR